MPKRPDWRSASAVETLDRLDRAGFAWEFLRRNPRYRNEYSQIRNGATRAIQVRNDLLLGGGNKCRRPIPRAPGACSVVRPSDRSDFYTPFYGHGGTIGNSCKSQSVVDFLSEFIRPNWE